MPLLQPSRNPAKLDCRWWAAPVLWLLAQLNGWIDRYLLKAPKSADPLYARWVQQLANQNEVLSKVWFVSMSTVLVTGFMWAGDPIMVLAIFPIVSTFITRERSQHAHLGWTSFPAQLLWVWTRLSFPNPGLANPRISVMYAVILTVTWIEVSAQSLSSVVVKHGFLLGFVFWLHTPVPPSALLISAVMVALFFLRRVWGVAQTDKMAALVAREMLVESRTEADALRVASESKSEFVRTLCHELRNPMTAIHGNLELTLHSLQSNAERGKGFEEKLLRFAHSAMLSSKHMSEVLNRTLTISKLEANSGEIHVSGTQVVCIRELVQACLSMFEVAAEMKGISLQTELPPEEEAELRVMTDASWLKQILINLLGNALKFTTKGSVVMSARVLEQDATQVRLELSVRDTGIGMTPEEQENLFSAFSQANPQIERQYGGSGLGLNIVKKTLTKMGGTIRAQSEKGHGSMFIIELPFKRPSWAAEESVSSSHEMAVC